MQTIRFHTNNPSTSIQNLVYFPPKSGARKAEWISAIALYFQSHASTNTIYTILNVGAATTTTTAVAAAAHHRPSPARGAQKSSPAKAAHRSSTKKRKSPPKAKHASTSTANANASTANASTANASMATDEAFARSLQIQEDLGSLFNTHSNPLSLGMNGFNPWGGPLTNSHLPNQMSNSASMSIGSMSKTEQSPNGLKRDDHTKPKALPVKVKAKPALYTSTSHNASHSNFAASASTSNNEDLQPRDLRETNRVASLREMGFDNTQEILTALRAVAAQREEVAIIGSQWSDQEQVEAAMMWIVTQREEAAEAQKLDEARISSEQADAAMEQSRKQEMERELKNANIVDLIGSIDDDDTVEIRSRHFPCSVLLRNKSVKRVMTAVASGLGGKEPVIRLLNLEKKARKWYGTVLPYSYFEYALSPRFESWAKELLAPTNAQAICQRLNHETDLLQNAMFNLSEQEEGGVGNVPKMFLAAQREASENGKTISAEKTAVEDDVEVVQLPPTLKLGNAIGKSLSSTRDAGPNGNKSVEVIDLL